MNVFYALSLRALVAAVRRARSTPERAARVERALLERCYDERSGLFFDLAGRGERRVRSRPGRRSRRSRSTGSPRTCGGAWSRSTSSTRAATGARVGIPSVAAEEPTFNPRFDRWRCWRGPSWMPTRPGCSCRRCRELGYERRGRPDRARARARPRAPRLPRVLQPAHGARARRARLRVVDPARGPARSNLISRRGVADHSPRSQRTRVPSASRTPARPQRGSPQSVASSGRSCSGTSPSPAVTCASG